MSYRKGAERERELVKRFRRDGWVAVRTAGSHTPVDVWALKAGHRTQAIQVKAGGKSPLSGFPPREREALALEANRAGADAFLVWWADRKEPVFLPASDWITDSVQRAM